MNITFSAANTAGLNNPGTEIITLVKDVSGNFINPPSYDKMRAYLSSGEVPMLFVTAEGGETGSLYQLVEYSETENKIRFSNDETTIAFSVGAVAPAVSNVIPKPLTYDYMPEGYPKKTMRTVTVMAKTSAEMTVNESYGIGTSESVPYASLVVGNEYIVEIDGTEIPVRATATDGPIHIGNLILYTMTTTAMSYDDAKAFLDEQGIPYTEEPFSMVFNAKNNYSLLVVRGTDTTHTIEISTRTETIVPIDSKYIPDMDSIVLNSSTTDSTKKFKITVNDSGTISATEVP